MARPPTQKPPPPVDPAAMPEVEAGGVLTVDLEALAANYKMLADRVVPAECAAVLKADAYGCGIEAVTDALIDAGCRMFFVAQLGEARRVRVRTPEAAIYVLNGYTSGAGSTFAALNAKPVISSPLELAEWDRFVSEADWRGGAALQVDTGMNRLGLSMEEAAGCASRLHSDNHGLTLLMTHLACADVPEHPLNARQLERFREIRGLFRGLPGSIANSAGIFLGPSAHADVVRPGAALYGLNPTPGRPNPMQPVVGLRLRVLQVRNVPRGETVGYGATWVAQRNCRIALVAAGYGDGIHRAASATDRRPGRTVIADGRPCDIVGRVSMDLFAVDVTDANVGRGDFVTYLDARQPADAVADRIDTIGYEVLTGLGRRYRRVYHW